MPRDLLEKLYKRLGEDEEEVDEEDPYKKALTQLSIQSKPVSISDTDRESLKSSRDLEDVASIGSSLQKLGTLGGQSYQSDLPEFMKERTNRLESDIKSRVGSDLASQKDALSRYKSMVDVLGKQSSEKRDKKKDELATLLGIGKLQGSEADRALDREKINISKADKTKDPYQVGNAEMAKFRALASEDKNRHLNIGENLNKIKTAIRNNGMAPMIDLLGPESSIIKGGLAGLAVDLTKLKEPTNAAQQAEVDFLKKNLLNIPNLTSPETAIKILENIEDSVKQTRENRAKTWSEIYGEEPVKRYYKFEETQKKESPANEIHKDTLIELKNKSSKLPMGKHTVTIADKKFSIIKDEKGTRQKQID